MPLSIVMYHYVRDLGKSRYPEIKGRDIKDFVRQLDHIGRHYTVVAAEQVIAAARGDEALPDNAAWLTFDDGYIDHYTVAFPLLHERGWQGSFFPPARPIRDGELLDVNRIHFTLAATGDKQALVDLIRAYVDAHQGEAGVRPFAEYRAELARASRLDPADVIFIKRMLQHALPEALRNELAGVLFRRFVSADERAFAHELYMSPEQLRTMIRCGMHVGSHGAGHYWLDRLDPAGQARDIDASLAFLKDLGAPVEDWIMCYPYGAHDDALVALLQERKCRLGLTTRTAAADLAADHPLKLPRLDTNDLPCA